MAGYMNRFIDLGFPDLAGVDENGRALCWVKLRNPRLLPAAELMSMAGKTQTDENGVPIITDDNRDETYGMAARLVIAGCVWDPTSLDEEPPLLRMPPTTEDIKLYPFEIFTRIAEEIKKATPQ